jgi:hypothetical protein
VGYLVAKNTYIAMRHIAAALCLSVALLSATGCGTGPAAIPPPDVDVDYVVETLLAEYDANKNGGLSRDELAAEPVLAECLSQCRRDQGDEISGEHLTKKLHAIFDPTCALVSARLVVTRNGQPLANASVRLVPLPVLQNALPVGTGVTDEYGTTLISASREDLPSEAPPLPGLMPPGLYLVEVTHPTTKIPEKYNRQTVFGRELSGETSYRGGLAVDLKL